MEYSIIIPAFNEEKRIIQTLEKISEYFRKKKNAFEIIVVNDGSNDNTESVVRNFSAGNRETRVCAYGENRGKGFAVKYGIGESKGAYILISDADLSSPIEESAKLMVFLKNGYDIAIGSRGLRESNIVQYQPFYRRTMGKIFNKFVKILIMRGINDTQCGFKVLTMESAKKIFPLCRIEGFSFDVEVIFIARKIFNFNVKEVPITWINSPASTVHPVKHSFQMFRDLFTIRENYLRGLYKKARG